MKETREQRLERIRTDWAAFKAKHAQKEDKPKQIRPLVSQNAKTALERGGHRGDMRQLLRKFWENWESLESDDDRLAELIAYADKFKTRVSAKRLRKMRSRYNRHRFSLLNIPDCKCGTCDNLARVRHHIIPLTVGGLNSPLNLILICHACHEKIHPWMKGRP